MIKLGFIDYYLDEWHANNYPKFITDCVGDEIKVAYAYGMIASPKSGKTSAEWCEEHGIELCLTIEEVIEKSDGLLVLSPDNAEMKEELSDLALKSGKPVFIDKTFTTGYESGKRMFDLAEKYNTPVYTTSALRYAPDYDEIDPKDVTAIECIGPNDFDIYSIHMLEPLMKIMKTDAKKVMYTEGEGYYRLSIEFADGRPGSISGYMNKRFPYMIAVAGKTEHKVVKAANPFWPVFTEALCEFFKTKKPMVDHNESLAIMAIRSAGLEAMKKPGEWVALENRGF
ncbi:MAG: Gfo/Idh/MocA family oxidoreductase [Clostridia bacterium]|nr:Gfo/Idh/MocA family oxidoreductase [Clostridia bacterium]